MHEQTWMLLIESQQNKAQKNSVYTLWHILHNSWSVIKLHSYKSCPKDDNQSIECCTITELRLTNSFIFYVVNIKSCYFPSVVRKTALWSLSSHKVCVIYQYSWVNCFVLSIKLVSSHSYRYSVNRLAVESAIQTKTCITFRYQGLFG